MSRSLPFASNRSTLIVVLLLGMIGVAGLAFQYGLTRSQLARAEPLPSTSDEAVDATADADSGTDILLALAREAMRDGRLIAPAGSNAYEFYLSVLELEPDSRVAQEALRESFARASEEIERTINRYELEEARREIDLLREFDRHNFTLALLGGKLSAARHVLTQRHEAEARLIQQGKTRETPAP